MSTGVGNILGRAIEEKRILGEGGGAGSGGMGTEIILRECYRDGGVSWKVQFCVAFSPVSVGERIY